MTHVGSCYISFDREFHCEFESAKTFFQKCNMTGQLPVKSCNMSQLGVKLQNDSFRVMLHINR